MPNLVIQRKALLFKIESTYNTDAVPVAATDAVLFEGLTWSSAGLKMIARPAVRPSLGMLRQLYAGRLLQVSFNCEVKGSGTAGTVPEIGQLLRACGMAATIVASTSVAYSPVSASLESGTMYLYEDGKQIKLTGCRGNVSFAANAADRIMASFTFTGHESAQTDVALVSPTLSDIAPPPFIGASFDIDSYVPTIGALSFDLGNTVATPVDVNAADGYGEITITARDVNGSIDPLDTLVATQDWLGDLKSGAVLPMTTGLVGGTAGNRVTISFPAITYRDATASDRDGLAAMTIPFGAGESTTDDEVTVLFT